MLINMYRMTSFKPPHVPFTTTAGYSFVEVLVSIAVLLVAIVAPMTIAADGTQNATLARERVVATFLAQEAVESVYYHRNSAALAHLENDSNDTWDWVNSEIPNRCRRNNNREPCRIENLTTKEYGVCNTAAQCRVYVNGSAYNQSSSGDATPYTRRIFFAEPASGELEVEVRVTWQSRATGAEEEVELVTYIQDVYGN